MKVREMKVYYCDHCNKRYLAKWAINRHEPGCTANPHRTCGSCGNNEPVQTNLFDHFLEPAPCGIESEWLPPTRFPIRQVIEGQYDAFIAEVHDSVSGCPFCMLAIIRQLHLKRIPWEYQQAKDEYWAEIHADEQRKEYSGWYL